MYLNNLSEYVSLSTQIVPVIQHPYLKCFIQVKADCTKSASANKVEKIYAEGSALYVKLNFADFIRATFDEWLECSLAWHQVYTAKTIQELLLLDEKGVFVAELEDLNF